MTRRFVQYPDLEEPSNGAITCISPLHRYARINLVTELTHSKLGRQLYLAVINQLFEATAQFWDRLQAEATLSELKCLRGFVH